MPCSPSTIGSEPICSQFPLPAHALSSAVLCAFLGTRTTAALHFTLWRDLLIFSPLLKGCVRGGQEPSVQPGLVASQPQGWTWKRLASGAPSCLLHAAHQNAADLTVKMLFSMSNVNVLYCNLSNLCTFCFSMYEHAGQIFPFLFEHLPFSFQFSFSRPNSTNYFSLFSKKTNFLRGMYFNFTTVQWLSVLQQNELSDSLARHCDLGVLFCSILL